MLLVTSLALAMAHPNPIDWNLQEQVTALCLLLEHVKVFKSIDLDAMNLTKHNYQIAFPSHH